MPLTISDAQAREVALRLAPADGRALHFTADGTVVHSVAAVEQAFTAQQRQVFACRRVGSSLEVDQVLP